LKADTTGRAPGSLKYHWNRTGVNRMTKKLIGGLLFFLLLMGVACTPESTTPASMSASVPTLSPAPVTPGPVSYLKVLQEGVSPNSGVLGLNDVAAAVTGTRHDIMFGLDYGLALKSDGTVWSWIINAAGNMQAGEPAQISGLSRITAISTGMGNSLALD
jgi:hypothetical protein